MIAPTFSTGGLLPRAWLPALAPLVPALDRLLALEELGDLYESARGSEGGDCLPSRSLRTMEVDWRIESGSLEWIPRTGAVLVTANHPFGLLEGMLLAAMLPRIRGDVKILANSVLAAIPELRELCIFADPSGNRGSVGANAAALRECREWLERGGLLAAFPSGAVSHLRRDGRGVADPEWNPAVARLAQRAGAACVPLYFEGANSAVFQAAGVLHPLLRTLLLPRELVNKRGRTIGIRVGRPVAAATLRAFVGAAGAIGHLRRRTELLARGEEAAAAPVEYREPIADAIEPELLAADVAALPAERKLCGSGALSVWLGGAAEIPHVLREIGRLREIAFRGTGEGTGHSRDLDRFDAHYLHLFLWNAEAGEVAGAYRMAAVEDVLGRHGAAGLYTSTLFRFDARLFEEMGPAIELGRSFVRTEYQKQYAPLLLLWKGILRYAASRPECGVLFGAASISNAYGRESRELMVRMLEGRRDGELARFVRARNPYRGSGRAGAAGLELEQVSRVIADLEGDGKGVPILLRQYLKVGGRVLGFNVDRAFAHALDALVMVDLRGAGAAVARRVGERVRELEKKES
ncbi:MAG: lysophospholipid acyltransferase family protein [Acidobacteriota bacterium]|nr:lysophospholipid acyltransferase family protein [Acidobacteriota bacterium]